MFGAVARVGPRYLWRTELLGCALGHGVAWRDPRAGYANSANGQPDRRLAIEATVTL